MKYLLYTLLILITFSSCSSQKKLQTKIPFEISTPTSQKWIGGKAESESGVEVKIPVTQIKEENIAMQQLYFRGKITDVTYEIINGDRFVIAKYATNAFRKQDIIMHGDSRMEVGNQPPKVKVNEDELFPFEIGENEAILSYIEKDGKRVKYTKISGIKDIQPLIYSSKPKN